MLQDKKNSFESTFVKGGRELDVSLRPQVLEDFIGQEAVCRKLRIILGAAQKRQEPLGHTLLSGPPGLGKTTLAYVIAKEMKASIVVTTGPLLDKPSDLAGILSTLQKGDVLFIDEIHRMHRSVEEYLYPAMEDFKLDVMIDKGMNSRSVQVQLQPFTLIGATTRSGLMTSPLRSRFALSMRLEYYDQKNLTAVLQRTADLLHICVEEQGLIEVAKRSRGTPRVANNLLRWVRDYGQMHGKSHLSCSMVLEALSLLSIDEKGLEELDKKILSIIIDHHDGGPVGLQTLAVALGEEKQTLEEVYEPFLIMQGFLKRTSRGRIATKLAFNHLGKKYQSEEA